MSLLGKTLLVVGVSFVGIALTFLGIKLDWIQMVGFGLVGIAVGTVLHLRLLRCPVCGAWLGRYPGEHCRDCGKQIPWSQKK